MKASIWIVTVLIGAAAAGVEAGENKSSPPSLTLHKLGVCRAINGEAVVHPTGHAADYVNHFMHHDMSFDFYPNGSSRIDTSVHIIEQPKHGRLVQRYPSATDYTRNQYKYIPDDDFGDFDYFAMEAKAGDITVQIYYTMSVGLPGEPTYVLDENGERADDLSRCPKPYWKISTISNQWRNQGQTRLIATTLPPPQPSPAGRGGNRERHS